MIGYILVISICICIISSFIGSIAGIIYYINNKRKWEEDELTKLIRTDIDSSMLLPIKRVDPTEDVNECEDSEKSCRNEIKSYKGQCKMITQNDGNLVLYDAGNKKIWSSNTMNKGNGPYKTKVEEDGNYVLYDGNENKIWETGKINLGKAPYRFSFRNEKPCDAVIYDNANKVMWSSDQTNYENKYIKNTDMNGYYLNQSGNNITFTNNSNNDKWTLTPDGQLKHLESGKCLEGSGVTDIENYLKVLKIRIGKLDEKMNDDQKNEMKKLLDAFGKGDLTDVNDIKNRIYNEKNVYINDCQDKDEQKWFYDRDYSNIRHQKSNMCLGSLMTDEEFKDENNKDVKFNSTNYGTYPCNSRNFKKKLIFE